MYPILMDFKKDPVPMTPKNTSASEEDAKWGMTHEKRWYNMDVCRSWLLHIHLLILLVVAAFLAILISNTHQRDKVDSQYEAWGIREISNKKFCSFESFKC
jgi:hypothetical protein